MGNKMGLINNSAGWQEITDGNLVTASFTFWNTLLGGWVMPLLIFLTTVMVIRKTGSPTAAIFVSVAVFAFIGTTGLLPVTAVNIIATIVVILVTTAILSFFKRDEL